MRIPRRARTKWNAGSSRSVAMLLSCMPNPPTPAAPPSLAELRDRAGAVMLRDQRALRRQIEQARRLGGGPPRSAIDDLRRSVVAAEERIEQRRAQLPSPRYPAGLPVSEKKDDILAAL